MASSVNKFLPLTIDGVTMNDPMFSFFGCGWALGVTGPWHFETPAGSVAWNCEDEAFADLIPQFRGSDLVAALIPNSLYHPIFTFSNGCTLRVLSDESPDPWSLQIEELGYVLVGRNFSSQSQKRRR